MLETTIAGSLPKPAWLAKPRMLWAPWQFEAEALVEAKRDATLLALKEQEDAGIDIVTDGEQARQHFVHGFLENIEGVDFARRVTMGIRNNRYDAEVPTVTGPLRRKSNVHGFEAKIARAHTRRRLEFTLPGPMTIVDTIADVHYGDKIALAMAFAALLNEEARELAEIGVDVVQFDEPAFNVYMNEVTEWGIAALHRAAQDLPCKTAVHICYGYGIKANIDWKLSLGAEWRQYEAIFPALATSRIDQVSVECAGAKVPLDLLGLLLPLVISPEEAKRLLAMSGNLKVHVMLALGYGCGLRAGEIVRLRAGDIDSAQMIIRIVQGKGRKGGRPRRRDRAAAA
jgi:5-methyltetrahydropteroyltriglutamate--homocysteine methyltransferase